MGSTVTDLNELESLTKTSSVPPAPNPAPSVKSLAYETAEMETMDNPSAISEWRKCTPATPDFHKQRDGLRPRGSGIPTWYRVAPRHCLYRKTEHMEEELSEA
eukprot:1089300-Amphidinium_carterae.1